MFDLVSEEKKSVLKVYWSYLSILEIVCRPRPQQRLLDQFICTYQCQYLPIKIHVTPITLENVQ